MHEWVGISAAEAVRNRPWTKVFEFLVAVLGELHISYETLYHALPVHGNPAHRCIVPTLSRVVGDLMPRAGTAGATKQEHRYGRTAVRPLAMRSCAP